VNLLHGHGAQGLVDRIVAAGNAGKQPDIDVLENDATAFNARLQRSQRSKDGKQMTQRHDTGRSTGDGRAPGATRAAARLSWLMTLLALGTVLPVQALFPAAAGARHGSGTLRNRAHYGVASQTGHVFAARLRGGPMGSAPPAGAIGGPPSGPAIVPTGQRVTPLAAPGAIFLPLRTGLRSDTNADASDAVATALSPDGQTLLVLTSGYNTGYSHENGTPITFPVLDPVTGSPSKVTSSSAQWVFVFDVRGRRPIVRQRIPIPNTYNGIAWDASGQRFYVSGGQDDRVYIYKASPAATFVPDAPFVLLGHNSKQTAPVPNYDGGLVKATKATQSDAGQKLGLNFGAEVAGVAVSKDGTRLFAVNMQNDSLSIADARTRQVTREVHFFVPGSHVARGEYPFWTTVLSGTGGAAEKVYVSSLRDNQVLAVTASTGAITVIPVGSEPNKMILSADGQHLYVANGDSDSISVIDTRTDTVVDTLSLLRSGDPYKGANPNSLALSPNGRTLFVTLGGENAVAVVDLAAMQVIGRIPTGWYPNSVSVSSDGRRLFIVNAKSNAGPNPGLPGPAVKGRPVAPTLNPTHRNEYILALLKAGLQVVPVPDRRTLASLTRIVDANTGFSTRYRDPLMAFLHTRITHVIYIQKENRTYDQVLGDLPVGDGDPRLTFFPRAVTPNHHALALGFATLDRFYASGQVSGDGWNWDLQGHANDFTEKSVPVLYSGGGLTFDWNGGINRNIVPGLPETSAHPSRITTRITSLLDPSGSSAILPGPRAVDATEGDGNLSPSVVGGYIWDTALRAGKTVRNYGLYTDEIYYSPGAPLYIPAVRYPFAAHVMQSPPSKPVLIGRTDLYYRGWEVNSPDLWRYEEWKREFDAYVAHGNLPNLEVVCLPHDHFGAFAHNLDGLNTPTLQMADNDYALARIVEAVSHSPYWRDTAIVVLEDDAQNGPDHVDAHRSVAYVLSAYTKRHVVIHTPYTTVNAVRTIEDLLGLTYLGANDANAAPMSDVFTTVPSMTPYRAIIPGVLCAPPVAMDLVAGCRDRSMPRTTAVSTAHDGGWWAAMTRGDNFARPDAVNSVRFNRVLWTGIMGSRMSPALTHAATGSRETPATP